MEGTPANWRGRWRRWRHGPSARHALMLLGWALIVLSPVVGLIPGPGGVFVFAAGAALLLKTSIAAKRFYVRMGRRWPKLRRWTNKALRRHRERAPAPETAARAPIAD